MKHRLLLVAAVVAAVACSCAREEQWWQLRGAVLSVEDLQSVDWPKIARDCGINTLGTHIHPTQVCEFLESEKGQEFLRECEEYGICVEHQLHSMNELLPRDLYEEDPQMFRLNDEGVRTADFNCCVHSEAALQIIAKNAAAFAARLRPTNHRYYFWLDDGAPTCVCPLCKEYSASEQALIIENRMIGAIREVDPKATLAHLAYANTLDAPVKVKPDKNIFLEFAPFYRNIEHPLSELDALPPEGYGQMTHGQNLKYLEDNLKVFPAETTVILDYWLDVSMCSGWKKPAVQLPWHPEVVRDDLATYKKYGIRNATSFAVYMDDAYFESYPSLAPLKEYGACFED